MREALQVDLVWNIVNRLANAFGFTLREGQLHSGTRALHRFGYRFPAFLLADGPAADHGDVVANLRHAVLDAPATTDPALRVAAAAGGPLPEPWQSYATAVRDASYRITDADMDRLIAAGCSEDQIFEVTVAAAVGAALRSFDAGRNALAQKTTTEVTDLSRTATAVRPPCVNRRFTERTEQCLDRSTGSNCPPPRPPRPVPSTAGCSAGAPASSAATTT